MAYYYEKKELPTILNMLNPYENDDRYPKTSKAVNIVIDAVPFSNANTERYTGYIEVENIPVYSATGSDRVTVLAKLEGWLNSVYELKYMDE